MPTLLAAFALSASVLAAVGEPGSAAAAERSATAVSPRLSTFSSCGQLLSYTRTRALRLLRPYGIAGYASVLPVAVPTDGAREGAPTTGAAPQPAQGVDYSGTNVQEPGIDEPDIVKTDGRRMLTVTEGAGGPAVHALDVTGGTVRPVGRLDLPDDLSGPQLLLSGDRLLVIANGTPPPGDSPAAAPARDRRAAPSPSPLPFVSEQGTVLTLVDASDPAAMRVVETLRLRGTFVAARQAGTAVRVVISTDPGPLPLVMAGESAARSQGAARRSNRRVVSTSRLRTWVPSFARERGRRTTARGTLVPCREVQRPQRFSGLRMVSVTTIDLAQGLTPTDADAVQTDGELVYASPDALYIATPRWIDPATEPSPGAVRGLTTEIHRFDTSSPTETVYAGSGSVPGFLLNQFSMSEHEGTLRVASTDMPPWWGSDRESESHVTTLRPQAGALAQVGHVGGLGRGERIYAVRFLGNRGYVVTFRQTDPLHTLDLSDPARPRVRGELTIPGYSAYLHPVSDTLLLGVGQNATPDGRLLGTQVSLFDVSDLANPVRLHQTTFPDSWSEAESDHHAFLYWAPTGLAVIPIATTAPDGSGSLEAAGLLVSRESGITRVRRIAHPSGSEQSSAIRRSVVVGDALLTVSARGVMASDLYSLAARAWVPLP
jgi:hypothetical protein